MLLAQGRQSTDPYHYNPTFSYLESIPRTKEQKFQSSDHAAPSIPINFQLFVAEQNYIQQLNVNATQVFVYDEQAQLIEHIPRHISQQQERLMQSEQPVSQSSWQYSNGQLTPVSARNHNRESSLSSLNSVGPASPYNLANSQHPVILPSEPVGEVYYDGLTDQNTSNFSKTTGAEDYMPAAFQHNYSMHSYNIQPTYNQLMSMQKQNMGEENMPAPEYSHTPRPSVASTHDSPATPSGGDDFEDMSRRIEYRAPPTVPKLDRTMSDVYNDELYSPIFTFTSAPSQPSQKATQSPSHQSDIFSQRLAAANNQHLRASSHTPLPNQSRGRSPFRQGSPLAPTLNQAFSSHPSTQIRLGSAAQMREQQKDEEYARALEEHAKRSSPEQNTPKTISPKDALLEYHETEEDAARPLFPPRQAAHYQIAQPTKQEAPTDIEDSSSQQSFASMATSRRESSSYSNSSQTTQRHGSSFNFASPSVVGVQVPQQYPFVPQQRQSTSGMSNGADRTSDYTPNMNSMEAGFNDYSDSKKPIGAKADTGTYTCTYHGCTLRFETPSKLQKHKREGHRQSIPLLGGSGSSAHRGSDASGGMTSAALLRNSQAGPHKCERINPSTGKPCNTIFSRPYDLTRHEDTIHTARKQKVRCHLCTEEKTFSRSDALTRHMRVVHPEVDFPGKHRRRL